MGEIFRIKMNLYSKALFISVVILTLFTSCAPTTSKDYQTQACVLMKAFVKDLKKIHDPRQLKKKQKVLKKHFNCLTILMMDYRSFFEKHPELDKEQSLKLQQIAYTLKCELYRLYQLDGGLSLIEEAQKDAYVKLGLFEHSLSNTKIDLYKSNKPLSKG